MRTTSRIAVAVAVAALALTGCGSDDDGDTAGAAGSVSIANVSDGDTVTSPVMLELVATGFDVEPAGEVSEGSGHFHVMIDTDCVAVGEEITKDDAHVHFGDGSTEVELDLPAGEHTLCVQLGDGAHVALDATEEITVTVE